MRAVIALFAFATTALAAADYQPTEMRWPGWSVSTSEELFYGRTHRSYPISHLFDGNPRTAWVFSGPRKSRPDEPPPKWQGRYALWLAPDRAKSFDGVRIMNGYNKSAKTFRGNRRVVEIAIYDQRELFNERPRALKVARLSDRTGWHKISFPRRKFAEGMCIVLRGFAGAKELDVAVSELRLTRAGKPVDMKMPEGALFTTGSSCGCGTTWEAVNRAGRTLAWADWSEAPHWKIDPTGRFVAGVETGSPRSRGTLWVADLREGRVVRRVRYRGTPDYVPPITWKGRQLFVGGRRRLVVSGAKVGHPDALR